MTRAKQYQIKDAVRGSFVGAHGRVSYDIPAGRVSERDVAPEVLAVLLASGVAVPASRSSDSEGSPTP